MTKQILHVFFCDFHAFYSNWIEFIGDSDRKVYFLWFVFFYRIYSWRYVYWIWCRWHYVPQQLCPMNREKHRFDLLQHLWALLHTWTRWTRWIHCNRVRTMVANSNPCNKVAPDTLRTLIVFPNTHRSLNHIMQFIRSQQHQPVDILFQLTRKVFLKPLLDQVQIMLYLTLGFRLLMKSMLSIYFPTNRSNASYHAIFTT